MCRQEEPLGGWKVKRNIDGQDKAEFALDKNYVLKSGGKVRVKESHDQDNMIQCGYLYRSFFIVNISLMYRTRALDNLISYRLIVPVAWPRVPE